MPGTLTVSTLSDGTNTVSATNAILGSAKSWVNYNAVSPTVRTSYNVSSVTNRGTGIGTVNYTSSFTDANYIGTMICYYDTVASGSLGPQTITASAYAYQSVTTSTMATNNFLFNNIAFFR